MNIVITLYIIAAALVIQAIQQGQIIEQNKKQLELQQKRDDWNKMHPLMLQIVKDKANEEE